MPAVATAEVRISIFGGEAGQRRGGPPVFVPPGMLRPRRPAERRGPYQEPASARGYSDGYMRGLEDARNQDRYDPVGRRDYRDGDLGYERRYGSRDAYRNNYRSGFRQGYEDGYREASRGRERELR